MSNFRTRDIPAWLERLFVLGLIILKLAVLPVRWEEPVGYDVWDFLPRVVQSAAGDYDPPLKSSYWA